jgi:predicted secreted protein
MSVGIGIIGREVTFTLGGSAVVGVNSKGIAFSNEMLDTTDDDSSGWTEFLATAGLKSAEFSVSGLTKNLELMSAYFNASQIFAIVKTYPDGSTLTFDAAMTGAPSFSGESNAVMSFEASFTSSGPVVFVPGV